MALKVQEARMLTIENFMFDVHVAGVKGVRFG
jgi:hypothetical protein